MELIGLVAVEIDTLQANDENRMYAKHKGKKITVLQIIVHLHACKSNVKTNSTFKIH